jgi:transcriptional regulator with XRE-family HTH domain
MSRDDALLKAFAAELRARRAGLGFSQEELAHRAEINRTYIAKLELAKNQPTLGVLHQLALALESELPEFLQAILIRYKHSQPDNPSVHKGTDGK